MVCASTRGICFSCLCVYGGEVVHWFVLWRVCGGGLQVVACRKRGFSVVHVSMLAKVVLYLEGSFPFLLVRVFLGTVEFQCPVLFSLYLSRRGGAGPCV